MATLHSTITGADNHEPKGVESATVGDIYRANGSGSGTWTKQSAADVSVQDSNHVFDSNFLEGVLYELYQTTNLIEGQMEDVSEVSTVLLPIPFDCVVLQIKMILASPITGADATVSVTRSDGALMGTQAIVYAGSTEGTTFTFIPGANQIFSGHNYIKLVSDGASSTSAKLYIQALIRKA